MQPTVSFNFKSEQSISTHDLTEKFKSSVKLNIISYNSYIKPALFGIHEKKEAYYFGPNLCSDLCTYVSNYSK